MSMPMGFIVLLILASLVAMVAHRWKVPYTVALVATGVGVSLLREQLLPTFDLGLHLTPDLLFLVLLPILIYEAAFHFDLRDFTNNYKSILTLAAPGLVVGIFAAGALFYLSLWGLGFAFSFTAALLMGAMLSATDPVAVISLFREVGAPKRLGVLMEGESLINDGVAVVAFSVILLALGLGNTSMELSVGFVLRFLGWEILGALLIGGAVGVALSWLTTRIDDHLIEITLTTVAAFGSFLLASKAHASGVLACLVAGMLMGNFGARYGMSATTRVSVVSFWEYAAFIANSFVFLLVGLEVSPASLLHHWLPIVLIWISLILARALLVFGAMPLLERFEGKLRRGKGIALVWGGLRGGIAMVLALSIPRSWEHRSFMIDLVFGVCLLTILVQGTTMRRLLAAFGLITDRAGARRLEEFRGRLRSLLEAIRYLEQRESAQTVDPEVYQSVHATLVEELEVLQQREKDALGAEAKVRHELEIELSRQVIQIRKDALQKAFLDGHVSESVARSLIGELDERLHQLAENE